MDKLGVNLPWLLAQLINFILVLVILRMLVYKPVLAMFATRLLPSALDSSAGPIAPDTRQNLTLGWIVAAIPRVGITKPF